MSYSIFFLNYYIIFQALYYRKISSIIDKRFKYFFYQMSSFSGFPSKVLGMYILLADDFEEGFEDDADWTPR